MRPEIIYQTNYMQRSILIIVVMDPGRFVSLLTNLYWLHEHIFYSALRGGSDMHNNKNQLKLIGIILG